MADPIAKILIIEDTPDNLELIKVLLEDAGFITIEARTGMEGIEKTFSERPDLIILDVQLPDLDGYEVLQRIRQSEIDGSIIIVAMTSYAMTGDRERLLAAGCDGYIEKPIDTDRVVEEIQAYLNRGHRENSGC